MAEPKSRGLNLDPAAESADPSKPAFLARPAGAPVYHGFCVTEYSFDGFTLGEITSFEASPDSGDAFLIAPDGSRCGLIWETAPDPSVTMCMEPTGDRWGVWNVGVPKRMDSSENILANLCFLVGVLRSKWEAWHSADSSK